MGGCFRGKPWRDDNGIENCWVILWGTLTRDPKITHYRNTKVEFGVKYHAKTYMNCVGWGDDAATAVMAALETKEMVLCAGQWYKKPYTTKDGIHKEWTEMHCDVVIPMSLIKFALRMFGSKNIQKMIEDEDSIPDVVEGIKTMNGDVRSVNGTEAKEADMSPIDDDMELPF